MKLFFALFPPRSFLGIEGVLSKMEDEASRDEAGGRDEETQSLEPGWDS